jgi:hypothetical protein
LGVGNFKIRPRDFPLVEVAMLGGNRRWRLLVSSGIYAIILALVTVHFYRAPFWDLDMLGYMGNARLHDTTDPVKLHELVYGELRSSVPSTAFNYLTGAPGEPDQMGSKHERLVNPYHYAEFLPFFAIRPMYNQTIYWLSKTGIGLIRSVRLVSTISYFLLGILVLIWLARYTPYSPALSLLIMLLPPISLLGRDTTADSLSILLGMSSLFAIFELDRVALGLGILLSAIWFRTDNIALIVPVLAVLWSQGRLPFWRGMFLGAISVISVIVINRATGDYGIQMLYYRNFLGTPLAPGEMTAHFTPHQYMFFFVSGFKTMLESFVPIFIVLGLLGLNRRTAPLLAIACAYAALHYLILPNWIDRWMAPFYLLTCMTAAFQIQRKSAVRVQTILAAPVSSEIAVA